MSEIKGGMAKAEWRGRIGALGATGEATYHNRAPPSHRALPSFFFPTFLLPGTPAWEEEEQGEKSRANQQERRNPVSGFLKPGPWVYKSKSHHL